MSKREDRRLAVRINAILVLMALWMAACLVAAWAMLFRIAPAVGFGNRETALGWLGIAGILAFAIWGIGFGLPKDNGIRRMSPAPLGLCAAIVVLVGFVVV